MRGRDKEREREGRRRVFPIQTDTPDDTERKRLVKNDRIALISSPQSERRKERRVKVKNEVAMLNQSKRGEERRGES